MNFIIHFIQYCCLSFHIVHLLYVIMLIGDREYSISFLLFPSRMKHRFSIQINIVHACKINTENHQQNMNAYISVWYIINIYTRYCDSTRCE